MAERVVGSRRERPLSPVGRLDLLLEGARFNDAIHALPGGQVTGMKKGVYRFRTHEEANRHQEDCIVAAMVQIARARRR
jgi:hypothetical protein